MEFEKKYESVFSKKVKAGKRRTYFFDVRKTKGDDYYLTLTESTKKYEGEGYERHKIFLYKEDFNNFIDGLHEAIDYIKNDLMPDYDFDNPPYLEDKNAGDDVKSTTVKSNSAIDSEDDLSW